MCVCVCVCVCENNVHLPLNLYMNLNMYLRNYTRINARTSICECGYVFIHPYV